MRIRIGLQRSRISVSWGTFVKRREYRRSGSCWRLYGEIVLAHVARRCPRARKLARGETHDAVRRKTHHDNMVKAK